MELTKNILEELYVGQRLSTWSIEKKLGVSRSHVYTKLKHFGIPPRSIAQSHILYPRKNFSGDLFEKAYLIGFTRGDLRVRKHGGDKCETIKIGCASTKYNQILLFKNLFSHYGGFCEGKPTIANKVNIEAYLNESFNFLLKDNIYKADWVFQKKYFPSFFAGFSDAEGSFFISQGRATFSLGNYDFELLERIKRSLDKEGIETQRLFNDHLAGYKGKDGYIRKKDYFHFCCTKKVHLSKLIELMSPFVRHPDKKASIQRAVENIRDRNRIYGNLRMN